MNDPTKPTPEAQHPGTLHEQLGAYLLTMSMARGTRPPPSVVMEQRATWLAGANASWKLVRLALADAGKGGRPLGDLLLEIQRELNIMNSEVRQALLAGIGKGMRNGQQADPTR